MWLQSLAAALDTPALSELELLLPRVSCSRFICYLGMCVNTSESCKNPQHLPYQPSWCLAVALLPSRLMNLNTPIFGLHIWSYRYIKRTWPIHIGVATFTPHKHVFNVCQIDWLISQFINKAPAQGSILLGGHDNIRAQWGRHTAGMKYSTWFPVPLHKLAV